MQAGTRLGHYEILSTLGRGAMGEVWLARDSKLHREVAIKALPSELAQDPERLMRLEREATLLAAVSHPNVAVIHGLEEHEGSRYLVLERIDGPTLEERLERGAVPVEEALTIAVQIAEALEAAHEHGVIHRDLKPANIKLVPDGHVKVLDFGLAKRVAPARGESSGPRTADTRVGTLLGTAPYMSPEQARGEAAGRPADIWALGAVLYEMLTGTSPFARATTAETLARVLETQPNFAALPQDTPASARHLLHRCLEKDARRRLQHAGDARIELEDALAEFAAAPARRMAQTAAARRGLLRRSASALAALALVALGAFGIWTMAGRSASGDAPEVARLALAGLEPMDFGIVGGVNIAVSPDGSRFAYVGRSGLQVRRLSSSSETRVTGSGNLSNPFFSPDGESVGYFDNGIRSAPSRGGPSTLIAESTERSAGATWGRDDTIVFATSSGLYRVGSDGSGLRSLVRPDIDHGQRQFAWPEFLPDGRALLFTILPLGATEPAQIAWLDLETLEVHVLPVPGTSPHYVPTGHLVYASGPSLMAVGFDLESRETRGEAVALRDITVAISPDNRGAQFAVSSTGTLTYLTPVPRAEAASTSILVWVDRAGNEEVLPVTPGPYAYARVSPDGTRIALDAGFSANRDIWIWDLERSSLTRLTDGPNEDMVPLWSLDGRRVFFSSNRTGDFDIYSQPADGSMPARAELVDPGFEAPNSLTPDGTQLVVTDAFRDLGLIDLAEPSIRPLLQRESIDFAGEVSRDGHWLLYESDESGTQFEIYLRPFPDVSGRREKVSINGGRYAQWGLPGSGELYYIDLDGAMMAVPIELSPTLRVGRAMELFDFMPPGRGGVSARVYDVSPLDGRFLRLRAANEASTADSVDVSVVLNWFEELRAQVPVR